MNPSNLMFCGLALMGVLTAAAPGQTWTEDGDAPLLLPGQETLGSGAMTLITGALSNLRDIDLYCIHIVDVQQFRASSVGLTDLDTQFFLFDEEGMGITANDDEADGNSLQSTITGQFVPGPGYYVLAVSGFNNDPLNHGLKIWGASPRSESPPDGPGAPGPLDSWDNQGFTARSDYGIALEGVEFSNFGGGGYRLSIEGACPGPVTVSWSGARSRGAHGLVFGIGQGNTTIPNDLPCAGTVLHVFGGVRLIEPPGIFGTGPTGSGSISGNAGPGACGGYFQLIQGGICRMSNVVQLQ